MLEGLKPFYNKALRPIARLCLRIGLHPNHVTVLGLVFFIVGAWLCMRSAWYYALGAVIIGALMDGLDGTLARETGKKTVFGAILDSSCDRLTEMVLLGGLLIYYLKSDEYQFIGPILCFSAICCSVMVSYIKSRCEGTGISCTRGLMQRPERIILLCTGLLAGPSIMIWILSAMTLLGSITILQRLRQAASGLESNN